MFNLLSRSMRTATRLDTWNSPDHWRRQHEDYRTRRQRDEVERARLRRSLADTGL
jgi:hypothetical protein